MKKLTLTAALLAALTLTACGNKTTEATPTPTPNLDAPATTPEEGMEFDPEFSVDPEPEIDENAQPAPDAELSDMVDAIYKIQPVELMGMETTGIDLTDETWYGYLAGLTANNVGKVDAAVISEPMTGSQAYSLVLLRLKDKADARVVSFDDKLLYVMADSELVDVDLLADAAAKAFNATFDVDDSLVNEDESELPPELLSAPAVAD